MGLWDSFKDSMPYLKVLNCVWLLKKIGERFEQREAKIRVTAWVVSKLCLSQLKVYNKRNFKTFFFEKLRILIFIEKFKSKKKKKKYKYFGVYKSILKLLKIKKY